MMKSAFNIMENPVFIKEMRIGFREKKVFIALTAWVLLVALAAAIFSATALGSNVSISQLPESGKMLAETLFWIQMVLLGMMTPSLTSSSVSGERERESFDMLITTRLSPAQLIFGKAGFAASFVMLALFATIPLESIVFFLGGVSLSNFIISKLVLMAFGLLCSLLGLMLSSRETRSAYANGQTYLALMFICWPGAGMLAALRYAPNVPIEMTIFAVCTLLYVGMFMFWKSVNHLEERARHIKIILGVGLAYYLFLVILAMHDESIWRSFRNSPWAAYGPAHYLLFGFLLNPMRPAKKKEASRFAATWFSKPQIWTAILSVGLLLPLAYESDLDVLVFSSYSLLAGLGTALLARGLALKRTAKYPVILGGLWLSLNILPCFLAIDNISDHDRIFHPAVISPIYFLISSVDDGWNDVPVVGMGFYLVLLVVGLVLHGRSKSKPQATLD